MTTIIGRRYGRSTVIKSTHTHTTPSGKYKYKYTLRCDCGFEYQLRDKTLGRAKEPCPQCRPTQEKDPNSMYRHYLYNTWIGMHDRCSNPKSSSYYLYGARGIRVCERWTGTPPPGCNKSIEGFKAFLADMGDKPTPAHTLDRIDGSKDYSPDNCRWATPEEQGTNRSTTVWVELGGLSLPFSKWLDHLGVDQSAAYERIRKHAVSHEKVVEYYLVRNLIPALAPDCTGSEKETTL